MESTVNVKALRQRIASTKTVEDGTVVKFAYDRTRELVTA